MSEKNILRDTLMSSSTASPYPQVHFFFDGDSYFDSVLEAIHQAKDEILIETYIFHIDSVGERVLKALSEARSRRVNVHLMVDGVGTLPFLDRLHSYTEEHGIDFRVFHPPLLFSRLYRGRQKSWGRWLRIVYRRLQSIFRFINNRNHRKTVIIDSRTAFVGSFNISEVHSQKAAGRFAWRDTGAKIESESVLSPLIRAYQRTWMRSRDLDEPRFTFRRRARPPRQMKNAWFRLNDLLRRRLELALDLRRRIRRAQTRILVTNAYFLPRPALLRALRYAALRGVYVGICIPAKTDVWMVREAGRTTLRKLIRDGVHVFEYQPTILHAKTMVIDDAWAIVGSHNLNYRSFVHDLEVDLILQTPYLIEPLVHQWDIDALNSRELTLTALEKDSWFRRLIGQMMYLVRYWM